MTKKSKDTAETPVEVDATAAEAAKGAPAGEAGAAETAAAEGDKLTEELAAARAEVLASQDKMLRMAAELENFKKRTAREKETSLRYAEENILKELLPSLDNLERAIEQGQAGNGEAGSLLEGVEMTLKGLLACLEKFGLKPIESVGQPFDPNFHEALGMEAGAGAAANTVLKEFQKGYLFKERLLRAAKVIVAAG
ncbi:MAG: nucleotide exchange factor GrpE [Desulfobulbaceae bacterium]|nr:nucleotide exchange factor GrpE [Desulfobulbaceae bacterium]